MFLNRVASCFLIALFFFRASDTTAVNFYAIFLRAADGFRSPALSAVLLIVLLIDEVGEAFFSTLLRSILQVFYA